MSKLQRLWVIECSACSNARLELDGRLAIKEVEKMLTTIGWQRGGHPRTWICAKHR